MAEIIAMTALAMFVVIMVLFHKLGSRCTPRPRTADAASGDRAIIMPNGEWRGAGVASDCIPMTPPSSDDGLGTPSSDYAIGVSDDDSPPNITAVRETRVISFIRFSSYTDSNDSISERSTGMSFWSAFYSAKESECGEAEPVEPATPPPPQRSRPYIPRLYSPRSSVDTVEIVALEGFAQRNLLEFKPHKPRALTTKRLKKPTFSRPPQVFLV